MFRGVEHRLDEVGSRLDTALLEPEDDVRLAAHRADLDDLLAAEELGGNTGVDTVGQPLAAFSLCLDHRGRVDAGRGTTCVPAENRVIRWDRHPRPLGDDVAHFAQLPQVGVDPPQQAEVHRQQIEVRVTDTLPETERATMDAVGAGNGRFDGIDNAESAIAVPVPVEADGGFHLVQHPPDVTAGRA